MSVTNTEYRRAITTLAELIVKDIGGEKTWPYYYNWYDRQVDRVAEFLMSDSFNALVDDLIEDYDDAEEERNVRELEADQAVDLGREP